jgi:hypothetical protein
MNSRSALLTTIGSAVCHISKPRITDFTFQVQEFEKRDTRSIIAIGSIDNLSAGGGQTVLGI